MKKYILITSVLAILLTSCKTQRDMLYFPDFVTNETITQVIPDSIKDFESPIAPDDMLMITISALDPNAVAIFNLPLQNHLSPGTTTVITTPVMQTYLVDSEGYIDFPVIGRIKLGGLTRRQAINVMKEKIGQYVENPIITLSCVNYKFSVLGEVNRPGTYEYESERLTILEAIGKASDMTIYGNHTNVLVIREQNGERTYTRVDLSNPEIFTSPFYYVQRNDVIYVEPNLARQGYSTYSQDKQYTVSIVSAITSAASVIATLCIALFIK